MNLSVHNVQPLDWPAPIQLLQETKVINQTGHTLCLAVAVYSIDGTKVANPHFFPTEEGHFVIPRPPCANPERAQVSLYWYKEGNVQQPAYEKHVPFLELFQNDSHRLEW